MYWARIANQTVRRAVALGVANPASIAWELVPYSFVVDWFVPVGNTLEAMTATAGLDFVKGSNLYVENMTEKTRFNDDWNGDRAISRGSFEAAYFFMNRTILNDWERPQLYAKDNPFSTAHILNAAALIRQLF
jgi:hypothetical protein